VSTLAPVIDLAAHRQRVDELVAENAGWAKAVARQQLRGHAQRSVWVGDAESAALVGLWKAARSWNGTGEFRSWAWLRVRGSVLDEYRRLTHRNRSTRCACAGADLDCATCGGTGRPLPPLMVSLDERESDNHFRGLVEEQLAEVLDLANACLRGRELEVVLLSLDGLLLADIGRLWGTTESNACQAMIKAKKRLRAAALRAGLIEGEFVNVTMAAMQWLEAKADLEDAERRLKPAADVLKAHFRAKKTTKYRGVQYACSTYQALDTAKARELLGGKASQAEVTRTRETLSAAA
jgi:RNA polymerase sigma factor (sigma-70 family)